MTTSRLFMSTTQQVTAFGLSLAVTLTMLASVTSLAGHYQHEAQVAAQQAAPASQQVVVAAQRGRKG
jgi:hypothetical protein